MTLGNSGISVRAVIRRVLRADHDAALTYFTALAAQCAGAKLPFKVPGPA